MSNVIDERVLKMTADFDQFESEMDKAVKCLERFEKTLDSVGNNSKAFSGLEKALDPGKLAKSLDGITNLLGKMEFRTSTFGKKIQSWKDALNNGFTKFTGDLLGLTTTLDQVQSGFTKFEEKTRNVGTLISQGFSMDDVNAQMERLITYTDETSYNFTDMVQNIGKFTSTGEKLDKSVTAMMGIANWAALSGQNATKASQAMYQLSQAMGKKVLKFDDWRSIQNASMDTKEFREVAIDTAIQMGKVKEVGKGLYQIASDTKKTMFTMSEMFSSDALSRKGWFDADIMMATFEKYAGSIDEIFSYAEEHQISVSEAIDELGDKVDAFGVKAFRAAQEARTWTDVMDSLRDAVSTSWMKSYELIFGDYEDAKILFTNLANELWNVVMVIGEARNEILGKWRDDGGREALFNSLTNAINGLISLITPLREAFRTVFPEDGISQLAKATKFLEHLTESLILSEDSMYKVYTVGVKVFSFFKKIFEVIVEIGKIVKDHTGGLSAFEVVLRALTLALGGVTVPIRLFASLLDNLGFKWEEFTASIESGTSIIDKVKNAFQYFSDLVKSFYLSHFTGEIKQSTKELSNLEKAINLVRNVFFYLIDLSRETAKVAFGGLIIAVAALFGAVTTYVPKIVDWFKALPTLLRESKASLIDFYSGFKESAKSSKYLTSVVNSFEKVFSTIKSYGSTAINDIVKQFQKLKSGEFKMPTFSEFVNNIKNVGMMLLDLIDKLDDVKQALMGGLKTPMSYLIDSIRGTVTQAEELTRPFSRKKFFGDGGKNAKKGEALGLGDVEKLTLTLDGATSSADTLSRSLDIVRESTDDAEGSLSSLYGVLRNFIDKIAKQDNIFGFIVRSLQELTDTGKKIPWSKIFAVGVIIAYIGALRKLVGGIKKVGTVVEEVGKKVEEKTDGVLKTIGTAVADMFKAFAQITKVYDVLVDYVKAKKSSLKYDNFKKLASGLLMLAGAMAVLALIPTDRLIQAGVALAVLSGLLIGVGFAFTRFSQQADPITLAAIGVSLLAFAGTLVVLTATLAAVSRMLKDPNADLSTAATMLGIGAVMLLGVASILSKIGPVAIGSALSLLVFAIALKRFFAAIKVIFKDAEVLKNIKTSLQSFFDWIWNMANESPGKAILGLVSVVGAIGLFFVALKSCAMLTKDVGKGMLYASASLLVLYAAIKLYSALPFDALLKAVGKLLIVAGFIVGAVAMFSIIGGEKTRLNAAAKLISKFSTSILVLSVACHLLKNLEWEQIDKGMALMISSILTMAGAIWLMKNAKPEKVAGAMLGLVVAFYLLLPPIILLGALDVNLVARGVGFVALAILSLAKAVKIMSGTNPVSVVAGFGAMAGAIWVLVWALSELESIPWQTIAAGGAAIAVIMGVFSESIGLVSDAKLACFAFAAAMLILAPAVYIMCAAFKMLGTVDWTSIAAATFAIAGLTIVVAAMAAIVKQWSTIGKMYLIAGAMVVVGGAVAVMSFGLGMLKNVSIGTIWSVAGALVAIAGAAGLVSWLAPGAVAVLGTLAGTLLSFTAAAAVVGIVGYVISRAIERIAEALSGLLVQLQVFVSIMDKIGPSNIWDIAGAIVGLAVAFALLGVGSGVLAIGIGLVAGALWLLQKAVDASQEIIDGFVAGIQGFADKVQEIRDTIFGWLDDIRQKYEDFKNSDFAQFFVDIGEGAKAGLETVAEGTSEMWDNVVEFIKSGSADAEKEAERAGEVQADRYTQGYERRMTNNASTSAQKGVNAFNHEMELAVKSSAGQYQQIFDDVGHYSYLGMYSGVTAEQAAFINLGYLIGNWLSGGTKKNLGTESPSKVFMWIAEMCGSGLIMGIANEMGAIEEAGGSAGESLAHGMEAVLDKLPEIATECGSQFTSIFTDIFGNLSSIGENGLGGLITTLTGYEGDMGNVGAALAEMFGIKLDGSLTDIFGAISDKVADFINGIIGQINSLNVTMDAMEVKINNQAARMAATAKANRGVGKNVMVTDTGALSPAALKSAKEAVKKTEVAATKNRIKKNFENSTWGNLLDGIRKTGDAAGDASDDVDDFSKSLGDAGKSAGDAGKSTKDAAEELRKHKKALELENKTIDEFVKVYGKAFDSLKDTSASEIAREAIEDLARSFGLSADEIEDSEKTIEELFLDMYETIEDSIEGSINMFEKFSTESSISPKEMIDNMQSNIDGLEKYQDSLARLSKRGFAPDIVKELGKQGPKAQKEVNTMLKMTFDQMLQTNHLYAQKSAAVASATTSVIAAMAYSTRTQEAVAKMAAAGADDADAQAKKAVLEVAATIDRMKVTYEELHSTVKDTVSSQIDLFSKFDKKTDLSSDELLDNMKSQIDGIKSWSANMAILGTRGIDDGLLMKLSELGPKGYEYVNAFANMTAEQLQQANAYFAESLTLPDSSALEISNSYLQSGMTIANGLLEGLGTALQEESVVVTEGSKVIADSMIDGTANELNARADEVVDAVNKPFVDAIETVKTTNQSHSPSEVYKGLAIDMMDGLINGIDAKHDEVVNDMDQLTIDTRDTAREGLSEGFGIEYGSNLSAGVAIGIRNGIEGAVAAAMELGAAVTAALASVNEVESPSRVWMRIGRFLDEGLIKGMRSLKPQAEFTAESIGYSIADALQGASDAISNDFDLNPVITPIVDLSDVENKAGYLSSLLGNSFVRGNAPSLGYSLARSSSGNTTSYGDFQINIYSQPGQNAEEIANMTLNKLNHQIKRRKAAFG